MGQVKKWISRTVFIIIPTLIILLFFIALIIETFDDGSMGISYVRNDVVIIFSLFLSFVILGVAALLISLSACKKAVDLLKYAAGGLFFGGALYFIYDIAIELPKMIFDYPLPTERYLRVLMLLVCAVCCFLPKKFVITGRIVTIIAILSYLALTIVPDVLYGYDYITVITENITNILPVPFSFISIMVTALFPVSSNVSR